MISNPIPAFIEMMRETGEWLDCEVVHDRKDAVNKMDDLIKRQDAITAYCEHECGIKGMTRENCGATDCGTIFDDIPSAQQWIPCSERLPEESGDYLVTVDRNIGELWVEVDQFDNANESWWLYMDEVTAWMPLPEPYKGEELWQSKN